MCIEDDLYDFFIESSNHTLNFLNSSLKYTTSLKANEEFFFDKLAIGQLYIIEVIPNLNSSYCGTLCPSFNTEYYNSVDNLKNYTCQKCSKMILIFHNTELVHRKMLNGEVRCFENNYDSFLSSTNQCEVSLFENLKVQIVPNDRPLDYDKSCVRPLKYHLCSIETKMINYKYISYRIIIMVSLPILLIISFFILSFFLLNYSFELYSSYYFVFILI